MIRYAAQVRAGPRRPDHHLLDHQGPGRGAGRRPVLGHPYAVGDRVAKAMPPLVMGRDTPLKHCLDEHPRFADGYKAAADLRSMYGADPDVKQVVDVALGLEGLRRQDGIHAAAVVITKELTTYLPISASPSRASRRPTPPSSQYEMHGVEDLGLLKMDFLGLRNLDVITDTVGLVRSTKDPDFDIDSIPLDDPGVYELLGRGDTMGCSSSSPGRCASSCAPWRRPTR